MNVYYDGTYYSEHSSAEQLDYLRKHAPERYNRLFRPPMPAERISNGLHIYQVYYNEQTKAALDGGFIPYRGGNFHNFENDIIIDIWRRRTWIDAKYVGVLSWRFYEKTGMLSSDLAPSKDATVYFPNGFEKYDHPFSREGYSSVRRIVEAADRYKLFPFRLEKYKAKKNVWCNYWVARPAVFDMYVRNYLLPAIEFFKLQPEYNLIEMHRGRPTYAMAFFLEGLFSVFLDKEKIKHTFVK